MRWIALALAGLMLAACSTDNADDHTETSADELSVTAASNCQAFADCAGADTTWVGDCARGADLQITAAEGYGCLNVLATWYSCLAEKSVCTGDGDYTDQGACNDQEELAEDCRKGRL